MRLAVGGLLVLSSAGCSGINATKSVSPIDFLLPGAGNFLHMQNSPPVLHHDLPHTYAALQPLTPPTGITP